jgi:hypothetical protein
VQRKQLAGFQKGDNMTQYKVVQVSNTSEVGYDSNPQEALKQFQSAIESEAAEGWELVCTHSINVVQYPEPIGCLGGLLVMMHLKQTPEVKTQRLNMLIFAKKS